YDRFKAYVKHYFAELAKLSDRYPPQDWKNRAESEQTLAGGPSSSSKAAWPAGGDLAKVPAICSAPVRDVEVGYLIIGLRTGVSTVKTGHLVLLLVIPGLAAGQSSRTQPTFGEVVKAHFEKWDKDRNGSLSRQEV